MKKTFFIAVTTWAAFSVAATPTLAEGDAAAGKTKSATCAACHMPDGNSVVPLWPKLAGQSANYITKQLRDFKAKRRTDPTMSPQAEQLSDLDIEDLAAYFSSQSARPGNSTNLDLVNKGKQIYRKGKISDSVIACVGCHGLKGAGNYALLDAMKAPSNVEAPAIGSQHAQYIAKQLNAFRDGARTNDVGRIMRNISAGLTDEDISAVAEYITTLER
jgi:cytochrome c553